MRVLKYAIPAALGAFSVDLPEGARILHVDQQENQGKLWALCDPSASTTVTRNFQAVATGSDLPENIVDEVTPLGTVMYQGGKNPAHIFEIDAPEYQTGTNG